MAASVRIEDEAFSDGRYDHLGNLLGTSKFDAIGRMAVLWRQCTQEQTYVLPESFVRVFVNPDFLVESRLGERTDAGIRIRGTKGRIEWLAKLRKNGRKGGRPRKPKTDDQQQNAVTHQDVNGAKSSPETVVCGGTRQPKSSDPRNAPVNTRSGSEISDESPKPNGYPNGNQNQTKSEPGPNPPAPAPAPVNKEEERAATPLVLVPDSPRPKSNQQLLTELFFARYESAYGTKPTWRKKQAGQLAELLRKHSASELVARMEFMFAGKFKWPEPPFTFDCYVANIDRWVDASTPAPSSQSPIRREEEL